MKKILIKLIIVTFLFISITGGASSAFAEEAIDSENTGSFFENADKINLGTEIKEITSNDDTKTYEVTAEEFGIYNETFQMLVEEYSEKEMNVKSEFETGDLSFKSELYINLDTDEIYVTEEQTSENGQTTQKTYDMFFKEIEGEDFIAYLIDRDTKELYEFDTINAQASAIPVLAIVLQQGAKWAIKKYGKKALISAFGKYALSNAIKKLPNFIIKDKHFKSDKRNFAKFNTDSQSTAKAWLKEALQKANVSNFDINDNDKLSFKFEVDLGKKIGTKGETKIRIVIGHDGNIWTAFPVK